MALPRIGNEAAQQDIHEDGHSEIGRTSPISFWVPAFYADPNPLPDKALGGAIDGADYPSNPFEQCHLNGQPVPGKSMVECTPKIKLKANKTVGHDGGPTVEEGHEAAKVEITITIWTIAHRRLLKDLMRALWRRPGEPLPAEPTKRAITIQAPACDDYGVTSILIESPESLKPGPEHGTWVMKIKAVQFIAPKKAEVTKKVAGKEGGKLDEHVKNPKNTPTAISMPSEAEHSARPPAPGAEGAR